MEIKFNGKYKSITSFDWNNIPEFVVITGPNGSGKSQLLELIYNTFVPIPNNHSRVSITGKSFKPSEVTFLPGQWEMENTRSINTSTLILKRDSFYDHFIKRNHGYPPVTKARIDEAFREVQTKVGKPPNQISKEQFFQFFPEILLEEEKALSQKIAEIFYNYRVSEIELLADSKSKLEIEKELGSKPWVVLREIIKEAKLPFEINDPSKLGFRDSFHFKLTHTILREEINFNDLSSGEKVLISLIFYLYNSQENKLFPKLFLLDEPDAHLHPSMTQQFLNVIKNVLVDKFCVQVIMTTHSPSTVIMAPDYSLYIMSRVEPRIQKSSSKNKAVSLLTAGLVYVGEGTKYFLVEDKDDVTFYSYIYDQLIIEGLVEADIPLVFIPASTNIKSGGKDVVQNWVKKLQNSGLENVIQGLIDADNGNTISKGIYKIDRYSIENYLADPILVYAALMDKEKNPEIEGLTLVLGEEYKLKSLSSTDLQKIGDHVISLVDIELKNFFKDFDPTIEKEKIEVSFNEGKVLFYPKWLIQRRGKTIINEVYNKVFTSSVINFSTLFKALRKLNMFPQEIADKMNELKNGC